MGSGPRLAQIGVLDIRKYYHLYSWFSFDGVKRNSNASYATIFAAPILANLVIALGLNALLANGFLEDQATFWNRFIFYAVFYVLLDAIPMIMNDGKPNNGMIIYELLRYGKRVDYNNDNFIPSTQEVEEDYNEEMKKIEHIQEKLQDEKEKTSEEDLDDVERNITQQSTLKQESETSKDVLENEVSNEQEKNEEENKQEGDY